jgi:ankyrin repeat protein
VPDLEPLGCLQRVFVGEATKAAARLEELRGLQAMHEQTLATQLTHVTEGVAKAEAAETETAEAAEAERATRGRNVLAEFAQGDYVTEVLLHAAVEEERIGVVCDDAIAALQDAQDGPCDALKAEAKGVADRREAQEGLARGARLAVDWVRETHTLLARDDARGLALQVAAALDAADACALRALAVHKSFSEAARTMAAQGRWAKAMKQTVTAVPLVGFGKSALALVTDFCEALVQLGAACGLQTPLDTQVAHRIQGHILRKIIATQRIDVLRDCIALFPTLLATTESIVRIEGLPLTEAIETGNVHVVRELVRAGPAVRHALGHSMAYPPYPDAAAFGTETPLMFAAERGYADIVQFLLQDNPAYNVNASLPMGRTALMIAAMKGHAAVVRAILDATDVGRLHVNATDSFFRDSTVLMMAASSGVDVVRAIITSPHVHGIDFHAKDRDGHTALHRAVIRDRQGICSETTHTRTSLLLASGRVDVAATNIEGKNALALAVLGTTNNAALGALLALPADALKSCWAAKDALGGTPVILAAESSSDALARILAHPVHAQHVDVNATYLGRSPLEAAVRAGNVNSARILLAHDKIILPPGIDKLVHSRRDDCPDIARAFQDLLASRDAHTASVTAAASEFVSAHAAADAADAGGKAGGRAGCKRGRGD